MTAFVLRFLLLPLILVLVVVPASARLIGDTATPFSADRTVVWKGKPYLGRVYAVPGKQRHEVTLGGFHPVLILRADRQMAYLLLPEAHLYTQFPFPDYIATQGGTETLGRSVGTDTVDGRKVQKYALDRRDSDGDGIEGFLWMTLDGIPMKLDGAYLAPEHHPAAASLELSNVKEGPQSPALFEVPDGFTKVPPELIQSLMTLQAPRK